jgi:hypothetical protein
MNVYAFKMLATKIVSAQRRPFLRTTNSVQAFRRYLFKHVKSKIQFYCLKLTIAYFELSAIYIRYKFITQ